MRWVLLSILCLMLASAAEAKVLTRTVEYRQGDVTLEGYLATPAKARGKLPGVVLVHEWKGLDAYAKKRAEQVAELGYVVLAADIYGKGVRPQSTEEAGKTSGIYKGNRLLLRERIRVAVEELKKQKNVDPAKLGAMGYCFGGTTVLELARSGADVAGVVSLHGSLDTPTPDDGKNIKAKVLVLHGADDPMVPEKDVRALEEEMRTGKVDWQLVKYGGAVHGFTNPDAGKANIPGYTYQAEADRRSWEATRNFFREIFGR